MFDLFSDVIIPVVFFSPVAILTIAAIVYIVRMQCKYNSHSYATQGTILEVKYSDISMCRYFKVEYMYDGVLYQEFTGNALPPRIRNLDLDKGDTLRILVNPKNPKDVYLSNTKKHLVWCHN